MNKYVKNLNRIEFIVTLACTGKCRHCSEGDHDGCTEHIDPSFAVRAVSKIAAHYDIKSLMTFGGEALMYPETVCAIQKAAAEAGIPTRQLITNGYFSNQPERIAEVARRLAESGVNDLLLSADAFHQETIPLGPVRYFAECAVKAKIPVRLNPAWLVSREDSNPYNLRTREILREFDALGIPVGKGNVIFAQGNALRYLAEYFGSEPDPSTPYNVDPLDIRCLGFEPNGDVLNGNIYRTDILEIIESYRPEEK